MANNPRATENLKPFKKKDVRINRKGRPRSFDLLRDLTVDMFSRQAKDANGTPIVIEGKPVTMIEYVMWKMIRSKDPREVQYAVQVAFGKVPDKLDITTDKLIVIKSYDYNNAIAAITAGPGPDSETPS